MKGSEVFVSKIPSMRITDLATALAPECEQEIIGIRPGEKLHEIMVPVDEGRRTWEFDDFFVILPDDVASHPSSIVYEDRKGEPVPENFEYSSHANPVWVTIEELRTLIPTDPE